MSRSSMTPAECWSDLADKPAPLPWHRNERALWNEQVPDFWAVAHWVRQTPPGSSRIHRRALVPFRTPGPWTRRKSDAPSFLESV